MSQASIKFPILEPLLCLPIPVRAAGPATRPALSFQQFFLHAHNVFFACVVLFHNRRPADPFISGEGSEAIPFLQYIGVFQEYVFHIIGHVVYDAGGDFLLRHRPSIDLFHRTFLEKNHFLIVSGVQ